MYSKSNTLSIIPLPARIERQAGQFAITPETVIVADAHNQRNAAYLQNLIAPSAVRNMDTPLDSAIEF